MLSISPPKRAGDAMAYFADHLRSESAQGEETSDPHDAAPGHWQGQGAAALGLAGPVSTAALARLLIGVDLQDRPLVQNATKPDRRAAWDLVFSAPKSVSVVWALGEPELAEAVQAAHCAAVEQALIQMERHHAIGRRGKGGRRKESARLVIARFEHHTSRENDPQLHTHALVLNLAQCADGRWGALESKPLFQATLEIGAAYRAELARELQALGLPLEPDGDAFRIATVPRALERLFSRRRQQVEGQLQRWGRHSPRAAEIATLMTRPEKRNLPLEELRQIWRLQAAASGRPDIETDTASQPPFGETPTELPLSVPSRSPGL